MSKSLKTALAAIKPLSHQEVEAHVGNIARDGYSILHNAIDPDFLHEIEAELERLQAVRPGGDVAPMPFTGHVTRRWFDLLNDGEIWQRVAIHPWIMQIMPHVLGEGFLLSTMGSAIIGDGEPAQPIHVDHGIYEFPRPHPNFVCNTMWALTDFTEENGATRIVPGSNNWNHDPDMEAAYESLPLAMPAGSIGFVVGGLYHGAGANRSGKDRGGLTINYCSGSMRQQENLMLSVDSARMMTFPTELQDILGFKMCKSAGHIFAQLPRLELERHYGEGRRDDPYLSTRDSLHADRLKTQVPHRHADAAAKASEH